MSTVTGDVMTQEKRKVADLYVHPFNLEIYGEPDDGLAESLNNFGLQHPIHITPDGGIVSGARRWTAARKLGWDLIDVEVPGLDYSDEVAVQKYTLLANAYRKQKTTYVQKREADAYYRLLSEGGVTKEELKSIADQKLGAGSVGSRGEGADNAENPLRLASAAAGMGSATYKRFRYVTDGGAESEVEEQERAGAISPEAANSLRETIRDYSSRVKRDEVGVKTADHHLRREIREAKADHSYSDSERRQRDANQAAVEANKKGRAFLNAIEMLRSQDHADHLDERHAMVLANTVSEIVESIKGMKAHGRIEGGRGRNVEIVA